MREGGRSAKPESRSFGDVFGAVSDDVAQPLAGPGCRARSHRRFVTRKKFRLAKPEIG
jgi:hypothetical protein